MTGLNDYQIIETHLQANRSAQVWTLRELVVIDGRKLRVTIRQDHSYDTQGHATVELWSGDGWAEVVRWFGGELAKKKHQFQRDGQRADFAVEIELLVDEAMRIIGGE